MSRSVLLLSYVLLSLLELIDKNLWMEYVQLEDMEDIVEGRTNLIEYFQAAASSWRR